MHIFSVVAILLILVSPVQAETNRVQGLMLDNTPSIKSPCFVKIGEALVNANFITMISVQESRVNVHVGNTNTFIDVKNNNDAKRTREELYQYIQKTCSTH